jgi:hypothetical protein
MPASTTRLCISRTTGYESLSATGSIIVLYITIGVRVSTYTQSGLSSIIWVETERNKLGVGSGGNFLGDIEHGSLLGTSGDDVTGVSCKESVVNSGRTELEGWVGNRDIEFHEESTPIGRGEVLVGDINDESTRSSINSASWGKGSHLGSFFGGGISRSGTELGVSTSSTPSPTVIVDWVSFPGVSTG